MKRLEEMHMLAEALDNRMSSVTSLHSPANICRWHGTCRVHTGSEGPDSKSLGS